MSPTRPPSKTLRWALMPLAFIAVSIALQHGMSAQALEFVPSREGQTLFDIFHPQRNGWDDDTTTEFGGIIESQGANQTSFDIIPWHSRTIEYSDLVRVAIIQEGRLEVVQHPDLDAKSVLIKKAALPEYIESVSRETTFYHLLDGLGVTPTFLGHVTEAGRITGFLSEYVEQQQQQAGKRPGWDSGTEACISALRRMHARGIAHRDAHGGNCLVRRDGSAAIVDFELAEETSSGEDFERDLWVMRHSRAVENES